MHTGERYILAMAVSSPNNTEPPHILYTKDLSIQSTSDFHALLSRHGIRRESSASKHETAHWYYQLNPAEILPVFGKASITLLRSITSIIVTSRWENDDHKI